MSNKPMDGEEPEIIYIPDDEGNEEEFEVVMRFEVDGSDKKYMMLIPVVPEGDEESDEVYAFRYEEDGDDLQLFTIDDEEEWNIVEETFNTLMDEMAEEEESR